MPDALPPIDPTDLRLRLLRNGWAPIPVKDPDHPDRKHAGKAPTLTGWQKVTAGTLSPDAVQSWARRVHETNTGLVCGQLVVVDLDVPVAALADRLKATAFALLGGTPFIRVGRAPKLALCYRVADPIRKLLTPELFLPDGAKLQVEILGQGQQIVGYGTHPDTRRPYQWPEAAPHTHAFSEVPETSAEAVATFLGAAEGILRAAGGKPAEKPGKASSMSAQRAGDNRPAKGAIATALDSRKPTRAEVEDALEAVPNTHDWQGWVKIGAAVYDALGEDGEDLFIAWSAQSRKNNPEATKTKWASFRSSPMTEVTAATLFWEARRNGWLPEREREPILPDQARRQERASAALRMANSVELTEDGVARAFVRKHQHDLRYCHDAGAWYVWSGQHWQQNRDDLAFAWARDLVHALNRQESAKIRAATGRAAFAGAVERFARSDRAVAVTADAWDRDLFLLGTPAGVVDLRSGHMRPARREDMITKITATAPADSGAACPRWLAFLQQATGSDDDLIAFLQRWCGYCLTGDIREHALLFVFGPGGNGKSVFLNTVAHLLGDYARVAPMETFTASVGDRHPTELAMLRGARLVTATETEEGRAWAEARIKQMTGGDPVSARFMRQDFFTYVPQFKLLIAGNHRPALRNVDEAARRRFNIVPFIRRPAQPDRQLEEKLRQEWPAILRWMIDGCLLWQREGLRRPDVVAAATDEYFEAQDSYGQWLRECCDLDASGVFRERAGVLLTSYSTWCEANGEGIPDNRRLRGLLERTPGVRYVVLKGYTFVRGIRLLSADEQRRRKEEAERAEGCGGEGW